VNIGGRRDIWGEEGNPREDTMISQRRLPNKLCGPEHASTLEGEKETVDQHSGAKLGA